MQKNSVFQVASFGASPSKGDFDETFTYRVTFSGFDNTIFLNTCSCFYFLKKYMQRLK